MTWLQSALGWPFDVVYNGAQSGDTTADCLARINDQCLAYSPAVVLMQMPGINDMSTGNGPIDEETIFKNQKEIIERILASGASMVILGVTPVGTGESRATLQNMSRVVSLNRRLQSYLKGRSRCVFIDSYAQIVNPSDTTGLATAGLFEKHRPDPLRNPWRGQSGRRSLFSGVFFVPGAAGPAPMVHD